MRALLVGLLSLTALLAGCAGEPERPLGCATLAWEQAGVYEAMMAGTFLRGTVRSNRVTDRFLDLDPATSERWPGTALVAVEHRKSAAIKTVLSAAEEGNAVELEVLATQDQDAEAVALAALERLVPFVEERQRRVDGVAALVASKAGYVDGFVTRDGERTKVTTYRDVHVFPVAADASRALADVPAFGEDARVERAWTGEGREVRGPWALVFDADDRRLELATAEGVLVLHAYATRAVGASHVQHPYGYPDLDFARLTGEEMRAWVDETMRSAQLPAPTFEGAESVECDGVTLLQFVR